MKRLISLRKQFRVFSRGSFEFVLPKNRKVLAYTRTSGEEIILCVANLSRFTQPAKLDLSRYEGLTPCEMFGRTEFPKITRDPYFVTLAPHSFYWFQLQRVPDTISIRVVPPMEERREVPLVEVEGTWEMLQAKVVPRDIDQKVLGQFLVRQRWFRRRASRLKTLRATDSIFFDTGRPLAFLLLMEATTEDGETSLFSLPLALISNASPRLDPEHIVARMKSVTEEGTLIDGLRDDVFCEAILRSMGDRLVLDGANGILKTDSNEVYFQQIKKLKKPLAIYKGVGEQSNTSVIFGNQLVLKLFRRLEPGPNPDYEILRFLNEHTSFERVPRVAGVMEYQRKESDPIQIGLLETFMPNQGNAWNHTMDELGRYYERAASVPRFPIMIHESVVPGNEWRPLEVPRETANHIGLYLEEATTLGVRTAELHQALSSSNKIPAFTPEPFTADDIRVWRDHFQSSAENLFDLLSKRSAEGTPWQEDSLKVLERRQDILGIFKSLNERETYGNKIRIHGEYNLAQLLWAKNDFVVIDFEGQSSRPLAERRTKQHPLKDVACMIRSFHYAAYVSLFTFTAAKPSDYPGLEQWAQFWSHWVSRVFLEAYLKTARNAPFLPDQLSNIHSLLNSLLMDEIFHELEYELQHRPDWVRIPLISLRPGGSF